MFRSTVFDTETSGFKENGLMQLAAIHLDEQFNIMNSFCFYVIPQFYTDVEEGAFKAHKIKKETCFDFGITLNNAVAILKNFLDRSEVVICHNYSYDQMVIANAVKLMGKEDFIRDKKNFCTMNALTPICKFPGKFGFKWPTLKESHKFLLGEDFDNAHDALSDCHATVRILKEMKNKYSEVFEGLI